MTAEQLASKLELHLLIVKELLQVILNLGYGSK